MASARQVVPPEPNVRAIYLTKAAGLAVILLGLWPLKWLVSPGILAAPLSAVTALVLLPTIAVVLWSGEVPRRLLAVSLAADVAGITAAIHYGGVDQASGPLLYAAVIGLAGLLLAERVAFITAAGGAFAYATLVWVEHAEIWPRVDAHSRPPGHQAAAVILITVALFVVAWLVRCGVRQIREAYRRAEAIRVEGMSVLSHDLKNPLSIIHGYSQMIEDAEDASERCEYVQRIQHSVQQALDLIHNVLDASTMEAGPIRLSRVAVRLNDLVVQVLERYQPAASSKGVHTSTALAPSLPVIAADTQLLERAVGNLIANAIKYTDKDGNVQISTASAEATVRLSVRDTGRGISAAEQAQLFRKYGRTTSGRAADGSGLGLYIVRRVVEAHGGSVRVASEPGRGSTFTVELPCQARES